MPVVDFPALRTLLVRDGRLMALDVGSKTVGVWKLAPIEQPRMQSVA